MCLIAKCNLSSCFITDNVQYVWEYGENLACEKTKILTRISSTPKWDSSWVLWRASEADKITWTPHNVIQFSTSPIKAQPYFILIRNPKLKASLRQKWLLKDSLEKHVKTYTKSWLGKIMCACSKKKKSLKYRIKRFSPKFREINNDKEIIHIW